MLATFKYLSMLRASPLPAWYQRELSTLSQMRFRFAEKRRPDDYAVWVSEHMAWPVPKELMISAPQLVWAWDEVDQNGSGEQEVRDILDSLRVDKGRSVLMARAEEHAKLGGKTVWEREPWYGTAYRVEKLDDEFVSQASLSSQTRFFAEQSLIQAQGANDILALSLPGRNEFMPTNLDVDKREVAQVGSLVFFLHS